MKYFKFQLLFCLLALCLTSVAQNKKSASVNALADLYVERYFAQFPEQGTYYGIAKADNAALSDNSVAGVRRWQVFEDSLLRALKAIDKTHASGQDAITYGILQEQLEGDVGCQICKRELWTVDQMGGFQIMFSELADVQPVGSDANRNTTLQRWGLIAHYI